MTTPFCSLRFKSQLNPTCFGQLVTIIRVYYAPKYSYTIAMNAVGSIGMWQYIICNMQRIYIIISYDLEIYQIYIEKIYDCAYPLRAATPYLSLYLAVVYCRICLRGLAPIHIADCAHMFAVP